MCARICALGERKWTSMSASEEMVREQLDRIIARTELRVERHCARANVLARYGNEAKKAQSGLALMLSGLRKLQILRSEFNEPQPTPTCRPQARVRTS
jgi:hypothetical protein